MKKKLITGALSAMMGLSLVGGGTFAAFNDREEVQADIHTGTLDLNVLATQQYEDTFQLSDLKPGDSMVRAFLLENEGSLAINEVLMDAVAMGFSNDEDNEYVSQTGLDNNMEEYLEQFEVKMLRVARTDLLDLDPGLVQEELDPNFNIINPDHKLTLKELVKNDFPNNVVTGTDGLINLAPNNDYGWLIDRDKYDGIPVNPSDREAVVIAITMKDNQEKEENGEAKGEYKQNRYQGDSVDITFTFEATQWEGTDVSNNNENDEAHNGDW